METVFTLDLPIDQGTTYYDYQINSCLYLFEGKVNVMDADNTFKSNIWFTEETDSVLKYMIEVMLRSWLLKISKALKFESKHF